MIYLVLFKKDNQNIIEPFKYLATEYVRKYKEKIDDIKGIIE